MEKYRPNPACIRDAPRVGSCPMAGCLTRLTEVTQGNGNKTRNIIDPVALCMNQWLQTHAAQETALLPTDSAPGPLPLPAGVIIPGVTVPLQP
jgi:hypothetical protein